MARFGVSTRKLFDDENRNHVEDAKTLLDVLYVAAIGDYEKEGIDPDDESNLPFFVVPGLSVEKKKALCSILGKTYIDISAENKSVAQVGKIKAM